MANQGREITSEEDWAQLEESLPRFYAMIGHCITAYQAVEDFLPQVFVAALDGVSEARALAIFSQARGLEAKLAMVSSALADASEHTSARWNDLRVRTARAAAARNEMAHSTPTQTGATTIELSDDPNIPSRAYPTEFSRFELRKLLKSGEERAWTIEMMRVEYDAMRLLFRHLIGFKKELAGEPVPPHLLPSVKI